MSFKLFVISNPGATGEAHFASFSPNNGSNVYLAEMKCVEECMAPGKCYNSGELEAIAKMMSTESTKCQTHMKKTCGVYGEFHADLVCWTF